MHGGGCKKGRPCLCLRFSCLQLAGWSSTCEPLIIYQCSKKQKAILIWPARSSDVVYAGVWLRRSHILGCSLIIAGPAWRPGCSIILSTLYVANYIYIASYRSVSLSTIHRSVHHQARHRAQPSYDIYMITIYCSKLWAGLAFLPCLVCKQCANYMMVRNTLATC